MKTAILCLALLMACFPVMAQTYMDNRGMLVVYQDINDNPGQFSGIDTVQTIVILKTTRTLPEEAFAGTSVRNLTFEEPASISVIPREAFFDNHLLININIPASIKTIGELAFGYCDTLTRVRLPLGLEEIQDFAFYYTCISRLYIPDSVKIIGAGILDEIRDLESVRLPANAEIHYYNNDFYHAYTQNGKKAGVYVRVSGINEWFYRQDQSESEYYNSRN